MTCVAAGHDSWLDSMAAADAACGYGKDRRRAVLSGKSPQADYERCKSAQ